MFRSIRQLTKICSLHNDVNSFAKRFAGHSKWANIRHIKGLKDAERANYFLKLTRQMRVAIQGNTARKFSSNQIVEYFNF